MNQVALMVQELSSYCFTCPSDSIETSSVVSRCFGDAILAVGLVMIDDDLVGDGDEVG